MILCLCAPNFRLCSINFGFEVDRERVREEKREDVSEIFFYFILSYFIINFVFQVLVFCEWPIRSGVLIPKWKKIFDRFNIMG
jgi:hypothetical protein